MSSIGTEAANLMQLGNRWEKENKTGRDDPKWLQHQSLDLQVLGSALQSIEVRRVSTSVRRAGDSAVVLEVWTGWPSNRSDAVRTWLKNENNKIVNYVVFSV